MQAACLNSLDEPPHAERILVIRLGALGDVVRTLPAVADLRARYPRAHLAWLVESKAEGAVRGQPGIDEVLVFPREELSAALRARRPLRLFAQTAGFLAELRRHRFDLVMDFHGILKSGVIARFSGAAIRVGYERPFSREYAWLFANRRALIEPHRVSRFERNAALIDFLGIGLRTLTEIDPDAPRVLAPERDAAAAMAAQLSAGVEGQPRPAVIHPGSAAAAPYKRYPAEHWGEVARRLSRAGVRCIVSSGSSDSEEELAHDVVAASRGDATLAPQTPGFPELVALVAQCCLFLGSDSGPLHVASLCGTPVVQVLGPTDPVENRPWRGSPSRSLRVPVACSPCRSGCIPAPCLRLLPPATVVAAALELLAEARVDLRVVPAAPGVALPSARG